MGLLIDLTGRLLFGVVTAVVAAKKGRRAFRWLVIGFLLGPFGFILLLVISKNQPTVERHAVAVGSMRKGQSKVPSPSPRRDIRCGTCGHSIGSRPDETLCYLHQAPLDLKA